MIKTAYTLKKVEKEAVQELKNELYTENAKMVIYFCSPSYDQGVLAKEMKEAFPQAVVFGASTANNEYIQGKLLEGSVVAMVLTDEVVEKVAVYVLENIDKEVNIDGLKEHFEKEFNMSLMEMDMDKYIGFELMDGMSLAEEKVLDKLGDITNVMFIGGSAGDNLEFKETHIHAEGKAYTKAGVFVLMKSKVPFDVVKTQSFDVVNRPVKVTKADPDNRIVYEFDGRPALEVYKEIFGIEKDEDVQSKFFDNQFGLVVGDEVYVRCPRQVMEDGSLAFYASILEGTEIYPLRATNIVEETKHYLQNKGLSKDNVLGYVNFQCVVRCVTLKGNNEAEKYTNLFDFPMIGFSTYGEAYFGHVNATDTAVVFLKG